MKVAQHIWHRMGNFVKEKIDNARKESWSEGERKQLKRMVANHLRMEDRLLTERLGACYPQERVRRLEKKVTEMSDWIYQAGYIGTIHIKVDEKQELTIQVLISI